MALNEKLVCIAAGVLDGTATPAAWLATSPRFGFTETVTDGGAGLYTVNLDADTAALGAVANDGIIVTVTPHATAARIVTYEWISTSQLKLYGFDAATPSAADTICSVTLWKIPGA